VTETDELSRWLEVSYASAYRTACLILRNPADAEEAVQDAFLRVWRFRAAVPGDAGAKPWLYRVLVNACCSNLRRETGRRARTADGDLPDVPAPGPSPEAAASQAESAAAVQDALADLPEHLRIPVVLRYYAGLSEREIATAIRRRPGTVKSRLHEARRRLATDARLAAFAAPTEMGQ
jgi:RNA polymerase sigma-70 factor (ECF subfamily)